MPFIPLVVNDVFDHLVFIPFQKYLLNLPKNKENYKKQYGRYVISNNEEINKHANDLLPKAREVFNSKTLLFTYAVFSHYEGYEANLLKHKDINACTYTLDFCAYQTEPWDLYVDDKPYTLMPNQALAYLGNDQLHWRDKFPNPESQHVAMVFFHYAEPDHWFFTKGPGYMNEVLG